MQKIQKVEYKNIGGRHMALVEAQWVYLPSEVSITCKLPEWSFILKILSNLLSAGLRICTGSGKQLAKLVTYSTITTINHVGSKVHQFSITDSRVGCCWCLRRFRLLRWSWRVPYPLILKWLIWQNPSVTHTKRPITHAESYNWGPITETGSIPFPC